MKKVSLIPYFAIAFCAHIVLSFNSRIFPFLYFAPFFVTFYSRQNLFRSIWTSFGIGLFLDFCTTSTPMGFYPVVLVLTTLALHRFKVYFLEEKIFTFSLYTTLYSITYSLIFTVLHAFVDHKFHITFLPWAFDTLFLPILDTAYHLLFFTLPIWVYGELTSKKWRLRFLILKKRILVKFPQLKKVFIR